jgi:hypothetical protein
MGVGVVGGGCWCGCGGDDDKMERGTPASGVEWSGVEWRSDRGQRTEDRGQRSVGCLSHRGVSE